MKVQKLDMRTIGFLNTIESVTKCHPAELVEHKGQLVVLFKQGEGKKAIGRNGANAKKLMQLLNKKIRMIECNDDPTEFAKNVIRPIVPEMIVIEEDRMQIRPQTPEDKARLIGRNAENLKFLNSLLEKYHKLRAFIV